MTKPLVISLILLALFVMSSAIFLVVWHQAEWERWDRFSEVFIQQDGRVVDITTEGRSTSEGQSYGLFFALVANKPDMFEHILGWTQNNLADGDLYTNLPAWLWGKSADGDWKILDPNPASDADMWIAYSLLEAGRLWKNPGYVNLGKAVLQNIRQKEVIEHAGNTVLLPAPYGFVSDDGVVKLNPSYVAEFQLSYFDYIDPTGGWDTLRTNMTELVRAASPRGLVPDWFFVSADGEVVADSANVGSYDAIRSYLWAGLTVNPWLSASEINGLSGIFEQSDVVPEKVFAQTGEFSGEGPPGFYAAVIPYFAALDQDSALTNIRKRLSKKTKYGFLGDPPRYYDQMLALFGEGRDQKRYCFNEIGQLRVRWNWQRCD